jgi:hypothetical protein
MSNNYEEFVESVHTINDKAKEYLGDITTHNEVLCISVQWRTGGVGGGSCWDNGDTDPHYPIFAERESDLALLDKILEYFCPDIIMLRYKELYRLVEYNYFSEYEYYGNYTDYGEKFLSLQKLYDQLSGWGYI